MSLELSIKVPGTSGAQLKEMAAKLPKVGKLAIKPTRAIPLVGPINGFLVTGVHEGLSEQATERADHHLLNDETRKNLKELMEAFAKSCSHQFIFYAAWSGALPKRETQVDLPNLLELIANNHVGNRVTYRVKELTHLVRRSEEAPEDPEAGK